MSWNQPYGAAVPTFPSPVMYLTQMRTIRVCYQPHRKGSMRIERNWTGHLSINHQGTGMSSQLASTIKNIKQIFLLAF